MELNILEVHLRHLQHVAAICQEHVPALAVFRHILVFALLESLQFRRVVTLNPAGLVQAQRFPTAFGAVFILQTVLDNLKLQLTYRTDDLTPVELVDEQLRHTFIHKLVDAFGKLLLLHRIGVFDVLEHLRREAREPLEVDALKLVLV